MELAACGTLDGEWKNHGKIMQAIPDGNAESSWIGAGTVPIKLEKNRWLIIYHIAKRYTNQDRDYFIAAAILNFDHLNSLDCSLVIEKRLEHIMVPVTQYEKNAPDDKDHNLHVLFPCGSFELGEDIHIIYGGANTYVLAGKINKNKLVECIENEGFTNPAIKPVPEENLNQSVVI